MHNFSLADLVNRLNLGGAMHIKSIKVKYTDLTLKILIILYQNGIIRSFAVEENDSPMQIIVFLNIINLSLYLKSLNFFLHQESVFIGVYLN